MKDRISITLVTLIAFETFILALTIFRLIDKVQEIENNQQRINEYILNKIGG